MSSSQISYPVRLSLQTQEKNQVLSLKKGPQRETVDLEKYTIRLIKNNQTLQPTLIAEEEGVIRALTLWLPLNESWFPLFRRDDRTAYTTMLFKNAQNSVMQMNMDPQKSGVIRMELLGQGKTLKVTWLIDRTHSAGEELELTPLQMTLKEKKVEPVRYGLKEPAPVRFQRGRLFSCDNPTLEKIRQDGDVLKKNRCTFDFYLLDYGTASEWGDWEKPAPAFGDNISGFADTARSLGALPGIRLSPLTCSRKSDCHKKERDLLLENAAPLKEKQGGKNRLLFPLDITKEDVRNHIDSSLNYYVSRGIKLIHLDHLAFLFTQADWSDGTLEPRQRLKLLIEILLPFKKRGVLFSASNMPLTGLMNQFDLLFSDLTDGWNGFSHQINLAISLRNPPPLSLGGLSFSRSGKMGDRKKRKIFLHTQALLNGPALLADKTEDLDEELLESWKTWSAEKKPPLLPLEISEYGLVQDVLLLMNRQKMMAILNLDRKTRIISFKEGELAGSKGYSPSDTTSLKSRELILKMTRESSHYFRV
ncbi:MAG: hypothetical protein PQJ60_00970 [Spirochaetales bacterium]|nr:hypothetical protein [Spirochaetales bacterium]